MFTNQSLHRRSAIGGAILLAALLAPAGAGADPSHAGGGAGTRPDGHAPIGVMGDHMHKAGGFMLAYRAMHVRMEGNRAGTSQLTRGQVLDDFVATPLDMDMNMHMFGAMFAPWDWLTLMAMVPYVEMSMDHVNRMGVRFETNSSGVGDLRLTGLVRLFENDTHHVHLNLGFGFPTGGIDHKDQVPVPGVGFRNRRLPYPMQIGSGSFSALPGITYTGRTGGWSWGAQALGTVYLDTNDHHYRMGDRFEGSIWLQRPWCPWLSTSLRLAGRTWGNYAGADPGLDPAVVPTADPDLRGGAQIDVAPGLNFVIPLGPLGEHRIAVEALLPVYRHLNGPQLETDWGVVVGWQKAF